MFSGLPQLPYGSSTSEPVTLRNCREGIFFFDGSSLYSNETSAEPYKMPAWPKSHDEEGGGGGGVERGDREAAPRRGKLNTSFIAKDDSREDQIAGSAAYRDADAQTVEVGPNERKLNW